MKEDPPRWAAALRAAQAADRAEDQLGRLLKAVSFMRIRAAKLAAAYDVARAEAEHGEQLAVIQAANTERLGRYVNGTRGGSDAGYNSSNGDVLAGREPDDP